MWEFPTSMRPVARRVLALVVAVAALGAGFAGGYALRAAETSAASGTGGTLSVVAAGSLAPVLPGLLSAFAASTPGVEAPLAAQLYEGSSAAAVALTLPRAPYDLFVAADYRVIPGLLEPPHASVANWEVVFATDPLVLAYAPGASGLAGINGSNWPAKIVTPGVVLGAPNASVDPLGANVIFALELEDALGAFHGALYGHFFEGAPGAFAVPTGATLYVAENVAATALADEEVDAYFVYRSYAVAHALAYVPLNGAVDLGLLDVADVAGYASARTTVLTAGGSSVLTGAPILFALTVPTTAPDYALGVAAATYLIANATRASWQESGFDPIAPLYTDRPASLPAALEGPAPGAVVALPPDLASLLA